MTNHTLEKTQILVVNSLILSNSIKIDSFSSHTLEVILSSTTLELSSLYFASMRKRRRDRWSNSPMALTDGMKASKASIKEAKHVITQKGRVNMLKDTLKG